MLNREMNRLGIFIMARARAWTDQKGDIPYPSIPLSILSIQPWTPRHPLHRFTGRNFKNRCLASPHGFSLRAATVKNLSVIGGTQPSPPPTTPPRGRKVSSACLLEVRAGAKIGMGHTLYDSLLPRKMAEEGGRSVGNLWRRYNAGGLAKRWFIDKNLPWVRGGGGGGSIRINSTRVLARIAGLRTGFGMRCNWLNRGIFSWGLFFFLLHAREWRSLERLVGDWRNRWILRSLKNTRG